MGPEGFQDDDTSHGYFLRNYSIKKGEPKLPFSNMGIG
jgi:hypothetical protein